MQNIKAQLQAALLVAPKKDVRFYLNGVALYVKGGELVALAATNGHVMYTCNHDQIQGADLYILGHDEVKRLIANIANDCTSLSVEAGEGSVSINSIGYLTIDGRYPDVLRVIKKYDYEAAPDTCIGLSFEYLGLVAKVGAKVGNKKYKGCHFYVGKAHEAVTIAFPNTCEDTYCQVVIMPMRLSK